MQSLFYVVAALNGVFLHSIVFSQHEWDRHASRILYSICILYATIVVLTTKCGFSFIQSLLETLFLAAALLGGLSGSIIIYRLLLHPLKSFPGPLCARLTSFWVMKQSIPDLNFYVKLRGLHNEYGDFVRIRPREISICHPDAVIDVHGHRNNVQKGEFYDQNYPFHTLQFIRDSAQHKEERRYWDKAFNRTALENYVSRITRHYSILMDKLADHAASEIPVDASGTFLDLFFDVISELTFGNSFESLNKKQRHPIVETFLKRQRSAGFLFLNPWILQLIKNLPIPRRKLKPWEAWYDIALATRRTMEPLEPDIYTYLSRSQHFNQNALSEAKLVVTAGADTNAITISNVCYLLCRHPEYQAKLYNELNDLPISNGIIEDDNLIGKPCLTGIINEALRLHPPVPSGLQRLTPPEGAVIAGRYIPGDMIVTTPTYAIHRDARAFPQPNDFLPERWSSRPELLVRKDAFFPFGYGAFNCAGKPLAMMQLRMVVAMIFGRFELSFAPGKEEVAWNHFIEQQADCFTLHLEPLPLLFKERCVAK